MIDQTSRAFEPCLGARQLAGRIRRCAGRAVALAAFFAFGSAHAELYYSRDADGTYRFTNAPGPGVTEYVSRGPLVDPTVLAQPTLVADPLALDAIIEASAREASVELALVKAVIHAESGFDRRAVSPKGARGLMQLTPQTARTHGGYRLFDAEENVRTGVRHLRTLLDRYDGNLPRVLAAYNAGEGSVTRHRGVPPYAETQAYVSRVLLLRTRYLRAERTANVPKPRRLSARAALRARQALAEASAPADQASRNAATNLFQPSSGSPERIGK